MPKTIIVMKLCMGERGLQRASMEIGEAMYHPGWVGIPKVFFCEHTHNGHLFPCLHVCMDAWMRGCMYACIITVSALASTPNHYQAGVFIQMIFLLENHLDAMLVTFMMDS